MAEKVARSLGGATVKEVTSEGIEQAVRLGATKTLGGKIAKEVGETVVQTAAMPHTWVKVQEDKLMNDLNNEEYGWKDFSRSFTDALQETATERVGGKLIDSAFGAVLPFNKIWGKRIAGEQVSNKFIQSPLAETGEEYLGVPI